MIEIRQVQKRILGEQFDAAARIGRIVLQDRAAHVVGDARGKKLQLGILTFNPLTGHQLNVAVMIGAQQFRQVGGVVLPITIERRDQPPPCGFNAAAQRRALPAGGKMPHQTQLRILMLQFTQFGDRLVGRSVIDIDDLVIGAAWKRGDDFLYQRRDVFSLVLYRYDYRKFNLVCPQGTLSCELGFCGPEACGICGAESRKISSWGV